MSTITLRGATKRYPNDVDALRDASFTADTGQLTALLGPSGCGKSTILRVVAGLEALDTGTLLIDGQDARHLAPDERRVGMVFQSWALMPHLSVLDNVSFGLRMIHRDSRLAAQAAMNMLDSVGLTGLEHRQCSELSGGQQQRVALARALLPEPDILLLDEPLSNLEPGLRRQMRNELQALQALQRSLNLTVVYVTHDFQEAMPICVHPQKATYIGSGSLTAAASYSCK